jgi:hypothetical protein
MRMICEDIKNLWLYLASRTGKIQQLFEEYVNGLLLLGRILQSSDIL